jgi:hypothetical protein
MQTSLFRRNITDGSTKHSENPNWKDIPLVSIPANPAGFQGRHPLVLPSVSVLFLKPTLLFLAFLNMLAFLRCAE